MGIGGSGRGIWPVGVKSKWRSVFDKSGGGSRSDGLERATTPNPYTDASSPYSYANDMTASRRSRFGLRVKTTDTPPVFNPFSNPRYGRRANRGANGFDFYQADGANVKGRNVNPWTLTVSAHPDSTTTAGVGVNVVSPGGATQQSKRWSGTSYDPYAVVAQTQVGGATATGGGVNSPTSPESGASFVYTPGTTTTVAGIGATPIPTTSPLLFRKHKKSSDGLALLARANSTRKDGDVTFLSRLQSNSAPSSEDGHRSQQSHHHQQPQFRERSEGLVGLHSMCSRHLVLALVCTLTVLVGVQGVLLTAYVWRVIMGAELGDLEGVGWMVIVARDVIGSVGECNILHLTIFCSIY